MTNNNNVAAYFTRGDYNIIIVDYSSLAQVPCVSQVEWAPRFCGKCIAQLAYYLMTHPRGVTPDTLHLIGYSVGAHIAGLAANYVTKGKLGRITGLDPTILFSGANNRSRDLDPTDAHFVDVIHTAAGVLGQWGPSGHADFYVNGGTSQPGCGSTSLIGIIIKTSAELYLPDHVIYEYVCFCACVGLLFSCVRVY